MKTIMLILVLFCLIGCASIKPMELPRYTPPDFSKVTRPEIPIPVEGKDFTIDTDKGQICYMLSGQNMLTAKVVSEKAAYQIIEMLKQVIDVQGQLIQQKDTLIIQIDLARQYAEHNAKYADMKAFLAEIIAVILAGIAIAGVL